jgi:ribose/xylose/arabinose/galactoside ABC-type transport system permease subunit
VFGGRSFGGGRVRVYGCSPGCLLMSLLASLLLTIILNLLIRAF